MLIHAGSAITNKKAVKIKEENLLKFQTPVTLCSGEMWRCSGGETGTLCRPEVSASPYVSSNKCSLYYSIRCSQVVTMPSPFSIDTDKRNFLIDVDFDLNILKDPFF